MIQAIAAYVIVVLAAAWVLWSMVLPIRLRAAVLRALGFRTSLCDVRLRTEVCGEGDCSGCPVLSARCQR